MTTQKVLGTLKSISNYKTVGDGNIDLVSTQLYITMYSYLFWTPLE